MPFDHKHYVPIHKAKAGELRALKEASPDVRSGFTPVLEIMDVAPRWVEGEDEPIPSKSVEAHVKTVADNIAKALGPDKRFFADGVYIEETAALEDGREPMGALMDHFRAVKLKVVPVTGLDRVREYNVAVKGAIEKDGRGLCLRLQESDLESDELDKQLATTMTYFGINPNKVDLLIDYGPVITPRSTIVPLVGALPALADWRTVTIAACSFPVDMSQVAQYSTVELSRDEWTNWTYLRSRAEKIKRLPTFGDYTINHPEPSEIDPRAMRMSANIRYTWTTSYVVAKGEALPRDYIQNCANKECVGAGREWRAVGASHHIAFVVKQLASLP